MNALRITHLPTSVLYEMDRRLARCQLQSAKTLRRLLVDCCHRDGGRRTDPLPFDVNARINWGLIRALAVELKDEPGVPKDISHDIAEFITLGDRSATQH